LTYEDDSGIGPESPSNDLEELVRSHASRDRIQPPGWFGVSKERVEEFLINRIVDNLSALIPDAVVELTAETQLTEDKISKREECKEAVKNRKLEFTFELEKKNLPAFHPWVEFTPKLAGVGIAKLRFEYLAQPEIAAKDVKVTLVNGRLSEASINSLDASIDMSMIVNGRPVKLGTMQRTLSLNQRFSFHIPRPSNTPVAMRRTEPFVVTSGQQLCSRCGARIRLGAKFCTKCGTKQHP